MWIRSQEKTLLIDAKSFYIESAFNLEPENMWNVMTNSGGYEYILGTYSSKGKTIKAIDDIHFEITHYDPNSNVVTMPLEEEINGD